MTNTLGDGLNLIAHCWSSSDDVGEHVILPSETFEIRFRPDIQRSTRFICTYGWNGEIRTFEIYFEGRDKNYCHEICPWNISQDKACLLDAQTQQVVMCLDYQIP
uniref:S-protein homolog n=1 Tax=Kalanchoe fedtschenkoi TaxID=63787 RepID=A0A7N0VNK3_KALFE